MQLKYGGGGMSVFIDMRLGRLWTYTGATAKRIHQQYGGSQYYQSGSGLSGAGNIPGHPAIRELSTYRTDTGMAGLPNLGELPEAFPGLIIMAPIYYQQSCLDEDWPIVIIPKSGMSYGRPNSVALVDPGGDLNAAITKVVAGGVETWVEVDLGPYITQVGWVIPADFMVKVWTSGKLSEAKVRRTLRRVCQLAMAFQCDMAEAPPYSEFWWGLGLTVMRDRAYKVRRGVCWTSWSLQELSDPAVLQEAAKENVHVIANDMYLREDQSPLRFVAVGRVVFGGVEHAFETPVSPEEAIAAFAGDKDILVVIRDRLGV